jgi:hypothetical protein
MIFTTYPCHVVSTRDGSVIDSDLTYEFWDMARSLHGVFVSKNQTKVTYPPSTTRARARFTPAIFPLSLRVANSPGLPTPSLSS